MPPRSTHKSAEIRELRFAHLSRRLRLRLRSKVGHRPRTPLRTLIPPQTGRAVHSCHHALARGRAFASGVASSRTPLRGRPSDARPPTVLMGERPDQAEDGQGHNHNHGDLPQVFHGDGLPAPGPQCQVWRSGVFPQIFCKRIVRGTLHFGNLAPVTGYRHSRTVRISNRLVPNMSLPLRSLARLWSDDQGQDIAEYAVMLAVILVLVVGTIRLIGSNSNTVFSEVASSVQ
jgi:Flp pilus assembly pilin Flp